MAERKIADTGLDKVKFIPLTMQSIREIDDVRLKKTLFAILRGLPGGSPYEKTVSLAAIAELSENELRSMRRVGDKGIEALRRFIEENSE